MTLKKSGTPLSPALATRFGASKRAGALYPRDLPVRESALARQR
jgi:hypothetical protein